METAPVGFCLDNALGHVTHRKSNSETEGRVICQTVRHVPECIVDLVLILIITWYQKNHKKIEM